MEVPVPVMTKTLLVRLRPAASLLLFLLLLFFSHQPTRATDMKRLPLGETGTIKAVRIFSSDDGSYELYIWADTLLRYAQSTETVDTLQGSLLYSDPLSGDTLKHPLFDVRKHAHSPSALAAYHGIKSPDNRRLSVLLQHTDRTATQLYSAENCWTEPPQQNCAGIGWSPLDSRQMLIAYEQHISLYKSSDGGAQFYAWCRAPYHTTFVPGNEWCGNNRFSRILEVSPFDTNTVFVCGISGENEILYRTTDDGKTWDSVFTSPVQLSTLNASVAPQRLYFHPEDEAVLYLRLDSAVYRSIDTGSSWQPILEGRAVHAFAISQQSDNSLLAGCDLGVVLKHDGTGDWQPITLSTTASVIGLRSFHSTVRALAVTTDAAYELYELTDVGYKVDPVSSPPYPNPFSEGTTITTPHGEERYSLSIVDLFGRTVRNFGALPPGYKLHWNGTDDGAKRLAPGLYICMFSNGKDIIRIPVVKQ